MIFLFLLFLAPLHGVTLAQDLPVQLPELGFHLTAQPWKPLDQAPMQYLDAVEGMCRVAQKFQDTQGAIIDPYLGREHQYSTPYYAFAVGVLVRTDHAKDLLSSGVLAMEHATRCYSDGYESIPDKHGEFYVASLTHALEIYKPLVSKDTYARWHLRMETPLTSIMENQSGRINNWRTYAMKGEWLRAKAGLVSRDSATSFIEDAWHNRAQRERMVFDKWNMYPDWSSDPQSLAVEAVGRGNLAALLANDYDGPSAQEINDVVRRSTQTTLLLQSPTGQCPPNGRTDDHVFNDILYQLIFEALSKDAMSMGDMRLAGQYRRGAMLAFESIKRWQRDDDPWAGSFYITKNFFEPGDRVGYQPASQWGNYSGAMMFHLAEAYLEAYESRIPEVPAPSEIGGYTISTDDDFSTFVANAGGLQMQVNLRGASVPKYGFTWTPMGIVRVSKVGWDDRLGPSDGKHEMVMRDGVETDLGITLGPSWIENEKWIHIADKARDYRITPTVDFVHPLLVKFTLSYHYVTGGGGPYFKQDIIVTPDGVLSKLYHMQNTRVSLSVPLLINDGRPLDVSMKDGIATTGYPEAGDKQNFIGLNKNISLEETGDSLQSTYGWIKSARFSTEDDTNYVFIYPESEGDLDASAVKSSFQLRSDGFASEVGVVDGNLFIGRWCAGGEGDGIDLDQDGDLDVRFSSSCQFVLQLDNGKVNAVEVDRPVTMFLEGKEMMLKEFVPLKL